MLRNQELQDEVCRSIPAEGPDPEEEAQRRRRCCASRRINLTCADGYMAQEHKTGPPCFFFFSLFIELGCPENVSWTPETSAVKICFTRGRRKESLPHTLESQVRKYWSVLFFFLSIFKAAAILETSPSPGGGGGGGGGGVFCFQTLTNI